MHIIEVLRQAVDSIRAHKVRSSLTLLAIAVGVFAIISANTAVLVLDTYFKDTLSLMGGDVITVSKFPAINMGGQNWEELRNRGILRLNRWRGWKSSPTVQKEWGQTERTVRRVSPTMMRRRNPISVLGEEMNTI